jgi:Fe-S oxidoreductase
MNTKILAPLLGWLNNKATQEELIEVKKIIEKRLTYCKEPFLENEVFFNMIKNGKKIEAIKKYKDLTGLFLKEAKEKMDLISNELIKNPYIEFNEFRKEFLQKEITKKILRDTPSF